jgi:hypothetical protein
LYRQTTTTNAASRKAKAAGSKRETFDLYDSLLFIGKPVACHDRQSSTAGSSAYYLTDDWDIEAPQGWDQ